MQGNKKIKIVSLMIVIAIVLWWTSSTVPKISFYHWSQTYASHETDLGEYESPCLYIKTLDIAGDKGLVVHKTVFKKTPSSQWIPVVYIDNTVFKNYTSQKLATLVKKHLQQIDAKEVQFDCDWSVSTGQKYFAFLKAFSSLKTSATIRLHQIKYAQKTGVPPVGHGVLMYYNMSDFKDIKTKNYILDLNVARKYHVGFDVYPLSLDVALPLYSNYRIIRQGRVVGLINTSKVPLLSCVKKDKDRYRVTKGHYFAKRYLYKDDIIVHDYVSIALLKEAVAGLQKLFTPREVVFYDIAHLKGYKNEDIKRIVSSFSSVF